MKYLILAVVAIGLVPWLVLQSSKTYQSTVAQSSQSHQWWVVSNQTHKCEISEESPASVYEDPTKLWPINKSITDLGDRVVITGVSIAAYNSFVTLTYFKSKEACAPHDIDNFR
jgi:hypothetical protein